MKGFIKALDGHIGLIKRMKWLINMYFLLLAGACPAAEEHLHLMAPTAGESFFPGNARTISVTFSNFTASNFSGEIRARIYQASSATTVLLSDTPWKTIEVPADETVLETASLDFPPVRAKARFVIQWLEANNQVIGTTTVQIYPTNLFQCMPPLEKNDFGVFDPNDRLKPLLQEEQIPFVDLGETDLAKFSGKLAIIGPFDLRAQMPEGLAKRILTIAKNNVAVVWIQPPREENDKLKPSFYSVRKSRTAVIIAQADMVSDLAASPQSQLNLISLCEQALYPKPAELPDLSRQP